MRKRGKTPALLLSIVLLSCLLTACSPGAKQEPPAEAQTVEPEAARYLVAIEDEPDTVDFQCTSIHYTIAQNVFNRLVEMEGDENGDMVILPSLAESWEISEDRRQYTFHLRKDVKFSTPGSRRLVFWCSSCGKRSMLLQVDGGAPVAIEVGDTAGAFVPVVREVECPAGLHVVRISNPWAKAVLMFEKMLSASFSARLLCCSH